MNYLLKSFGTKLHYPNEAKARPHMAKCASRRQAWLWLSICFALLFSAGCSSGAGGQTGKDQPEAISVSENNTSGDMEQDNQDNQDRQDDQAKQDNAENSGESLWTQPTEERGQLFAGSGAGGQAGKDQPAAISVSENNTSRDIEQYNQDEQDRQDNQDRQDQQDRQDKQNNQDEQDKQDNAENSGKPLWAQPMEEEGQLFTGLNLDGIGDYDDEAYVSLYCWDDNGRGRYDASELVVQIRLGTGDMTAHIIHAIGWYKFHTAKLFSEKKDAIVLEVNIYYANSGRVFVFALDVYGMDGVDSFPIIVERLNTTGEMPVLSADGEGLYAGSLIIGAEIADIENKPLQGIVLRSSGDGSYRGNIAGRDGQIIYWNGDGWIALERWETEL
jgi:hypothetical protein